MCCSKSSTAIRYNHEQQHKTGEETVTLPFNHGYFGFPVVKTSRNTDIFSPSFPLEHCWQFLPVDSGAGCEGARSEAHRFVNLQKTKTCQTKNKALTVKCHWLIHRDQLWLRPLDLWFSELSIRTRSHLQRIHWLTAFLRMTRRYPNHGQRNSVLPCNGFYSSFHSIINVHTSALCTSYRKEMTRTFWTHNTNFGQWTPDSKPWPKCSWTSCSHVRTLADLFWAFSDNINHTSAQTIATETLCPGFSEKINWKGWTLERIFGIFLMKHSTSALHTAAKFRQRRRRPLFLQSLPSLHRKPETISQQTSVSLYSTVSHFNEAATCN